jgi:hypothetical protein
MKSALSSKEIRQKILADSVSPGQNEQLSGRLAVTDFLPAR